ncbi:prolyl oligopeptidase family serine peptidase [Phenylobacterium sp.]|uniref:S9 family peptidase n=1 Tax=Phenylobacterium sp. TaxID=1871053 RepID=UPI002730813A|nr:prolyl oligopeptidase family serine peptidase [Phenylobacterium sp.]MDP1618074.1 prolyl oligopeptidase family serine peptidase [Phenylobacterium sp.]
MTWLSGGDAFAYARETADDVILVRVDIPQARRTVVARASDIVSRLPFSVAPERLTAGSLNLSPDGEAAILSVPGGQYRYSLANGVLTPLPTTNQATSPDGRHRVFTRAHDLYASGPDEQVRRLSADGALWYSFSGAMADTQPTDAAILENRLDDTPPWIGWIGGGPLFYVVRQDLRQTGETWLLDAMAQPRPRLATHKMPYPGEANLPRQELWVFDASGARAPVQVQTQGWDHLGNLDMGAGGFWPSNDGRTLYFARVSRGYGTVELCAADVATGEVRVILSESHPTGSSVRYRDFRALGDGFLWRTERDGYEHYGLYGWDGRFIRMVTPEPLATQRLLHVDEDRGEIIYGAYDDATVRNPAQVRARRTNLATGESLALDQEDAHHELSVSPTGRWYVDTLSRPDMAPQILVRDRDGQVVMTVETSDTTALTAAGWVPPRPVTALADDGETKLYGWLWPSGRRGAATHPLVSIVYPGPSGESTPFRFDPTDQASALAELGPMVLRAGQRGGSAVRGSAYHRYALTFGNVRDYPVADNAAMIRAVATQDAAVDLSRVGIMGHSGGGLMATTAILLQPDLYKVAVASSGNHDNNIYEMGSGEFHFGHPITGPAGGPNGYATNQELASRLQGELMIVHGMRDSDVPVTNSLRLADALIKAGKRFEMLILPSQDHGFTGVDADYAKIRMWTFMIDKLEADQLQPVDLPVRR